jgi:hypothetical protein
MIGLHRLAESAEREKRIITDAAPTIIRIRIR